MIQNSIMQILPLCYRKSGMPALQKDSLKQEFKSALGSLPQTRAFFSRLSGCGQPD
jgi:hypothetical protein